MKRKLLATLLCLAISISMVACGSNNNLTEQIEQTEIGNTVEDSETIETEEIVGATPYAEEKGLIFTTEREFEIPFLTYFVDEDGNYIETVDGYELRQKNATYTIGTISVSEADENGNVEIIIHYILKCPYEFLRTTEDIADIRGAAEEISLVDYYTGLEFPKKGIEGADAYGAEVSIQWAGKENMISYQLTTKFSNDKVREIEKDVWTTDGYTYAKFVVTAPADYDGLMLVLDSRGQTEYYKSNTSEIDMAERTILEDFSGTAEDLICIRVKDLIEIYGNDKSTETEDETTETIEITEADIALYSDLKLTDEGYVIQTDNMTICYNIPYDVPSIVKQLNDDGFDFTKEDVLLLIACGYDPLDRGVIENQDTEKFGAGMKNFQDWVRLQGADYASGWTFIYENGSAAGDQSSYGVYMKEGSELYGTVYNVGDYLPNGDQITGTREEWDAWTTQDLLRMAEEEGWDVIQNENGNTVIVID